MTFIGGRSFHDVINHNVWLSEQCGCCFHCQSDIDPRSLARGAEYEILHFYRGRGHVADIVRYCLTPRTHFLVAGVIKEVVSWLWEEPVVVELGTFSTKPSHQTSS